MKIEIWLNSEHFLQFMLDTLEANGGVSSTTNGSSEPSPVKKISVTAIVAASSPEVTSAPKVIVF